MGCVLWCKDRRKKREQGTRSKEQGTKSKEQGTKSKEQGFRSETVPTIRFTTVGTAGSEK